jgi:hypothetical protein
MKYELTNDQLDIIREALYRNVNKLVESHEHMRDFVLPALEAGKPVALFPTGKPGIMSAKEIIGNLDRHIKKIEHMLAHELRHPDDITREEWEAKQ